MAQPATFFTIILYTFCLLSLGYSHLSQAAAIEEITASGRYIMGDKDSKLDGRRLALLEAKRNALEQAGTYIESITEVQNFQLSRDQVRVYAAGILEVREVDEKLAMIGESMAITITAKVQVDKDVVVRQLTALRKNAEVTRDLQEAKAKIQQNEQTIAMLNRQLQTAQGPMTPRVAEAQETRRQALTQIDVQTLLAKARVAATGTEDERPVGIGSIEKERLARARPYIEQALQIAPESSEALEAMGYLQLNEHDPYKAETTFRNALRYKPDSGRLYTGLGSALYQQKKSDAAYQTAQQALKLQPQFPPTHSLLGSIYFERGEIAMAIREFQEAIRLDPVIAIYHSNLAGALSKQGELTRAIQEAREAIRLDPNTGAAHSQLGSDLYRQGNKTEASRELQIGCQLGNAVACKNLQAINNPLMSVASGCATGKSTVGRQAAVIDLDIGLLACPLCMTFRLLIRRWKRAKRT